MSLRLKLAGALGLALFPFPWDTFPLLLPALRAESPAHQPPRTYSRSRAIILPIQIDEKVRAGLSELKLYVRPPGAAWTCVQTSPASQTRFDYRAENDGEYSFMFVTVDKVGHPSPTLLVGERPPHQIIVVDTVAPRIFVQPLPIASREIFLQCQVEDANPDAASIRLEYQVGDDQWRAMELAHRDTPGVFRIPQASVLEGKVRATAKDKAGNLAQRIVDLGDPTQSFAAGKSSTIAPAALPDVVKMDAPAGIQGTIQTGHTRPARQGDPLDMKIPDVAPKSISNYNMNRLKPSDKPESQIAPEPLAPSDPKAVPQPLPIANAKEGALNIVLPPDVKDGDPAKVDPYFPSIDLKPAPNEPKPDRPAASNPAPIKRDSSESRDPEIRPMPTSATAPTSALHGQPTLINSTRCTLDYVVENVIVGGQPKMEFWATKDGGRSWARVADESAGLSPAKLVLPGDGLHGIRIKANSNGQAPQIGEAPDAWVEVDTIPPTVRLLPTTLGTGSDAGTLTIQWTVHDKNLAPESINISYAGRPDGPFMVFASNVRNDGSYRWLIPPGIGSEVYLRIEAADRAGNIGRNDLRDPVFMPQPKVKVLGIRSAK